MAEQEMRFLAWNGRRGSTAVTATCSFCLDFAHSSSHQIFTQRRGKPCDLAREQRKGGERRGFCLLLAGEKGAALGQLWWGLPWNHPGISAWSVRKQIPRQHLRKAMGHTATLRFWEAWQIWWGEIAASSRNKVQAVTLKEVLDRPCPGQVAENTHASWAFEEAGGK